MLAFLVRYIVVAVVGFLGVSFGLGEREELWGPTELCACGHGSSPHWGSVFFFVTWELIGPSSRGQMRECKALSPVLGMRDELNQSQLVVLLLLL